MAEHLKDIAAVVGYLTTVGAMFIFLRKQWSKIQDIADAQKCQLRSDILSIYYRHCDEDDPTLHEYERKNLDALHAAYKVLRGNSFIDDIYELMRHWHVTR